MNGMNARSIHGDAEARRRGTLDAAAALLDEGGYAALTIRAVAQRAGTSTGLIYQYFTDKQDIFVALLEESQAESADFVASLPRTDGVAALIEALIPESARQWRRVVRMTAAWRDTTGATERDRSESVSRLRESFGRYDDALRHALVEAARIEGRSLTDDPAMLRFVHSGLAGVSDALVNDWGDLDPAELVTFAAHAITRGITS
ncbi:TetR family transcriptional regulator [Nocardioides sp. Root151]|nr:TetR family transcriptional regulator [Nocardioides sp. Root151]KRF10372.1 TetR family transcriptional regulator [Nocardioides sp. Soil796]